MKKRNNNMPTGAKRFLKAWICLVLVLCMVGSLTLVCFADDVSDPITVINNLSDFMFGLIRAGGMIIMGFVTYLIISKMSSNAGPVSGKLRKRSK